MKKAKFFRYAALALAAVCALTLAGCPTDPEPDPDPDPALISSWTNETGEEGSIHHGLVKEFTINPDFTFTASINPVFIAAFYGAKGQGAGNEDAIAAGEGAVATLGKTELLARWAVEGKLTGGSYYYMSNLRETFGQQALGLTEPGATANDEVGQFGGPVSIVLNDDKDAFDFASAESGGTSSQVNMFFGGHYTKVLPPAN